MKINGKLEYKIKENLFDAVVRRGGNMPAVKQSYVRIQNEVYKYPEISRKLTEELKLLTDANRYYYTPIRSKVDKFWTFMNLGLDRGSNGKTGTLLSTHDIAYQVIARYAAMTAGETKASVHKVCNKENIDERELMRAVFHLDWDKLSKYKVNPFIKVSRAMEEKLITKLELQEDINYISSILDHTKCDFSKYENTIEFRGLVLCSVNFVYYANLVLETACIELNKLGYQIESNSISGVLFDYMKEAEPILIETDENRSITVIPRKYERSDLTNYDSWRNL